MPLAGVAQDGKIAFKHFDLGVSAGTCGFGLEVATPLSKSAQLRAGGVLHTSPSYTYSLDVWKPIGMNENSSVMKMMTSALGHSPASTINIGGTLNMQNVKLIVDMFPIKKNHNFYVSLGLYYGNSILVEGINSASSFNTLAFIRAYNKLYDNACRGKFLDLTSLNVKLPQEVLDILNGSVLPEIVEAGDITIPVGTYAHDIYGADGALLYKAGDIVMLRPDSKDVVSVDVKVNKWKPYVGVGYTIPLGGSSSISVDAGALIWGGRPKVKTKVVDFDASGNRISTNIDLLRDVDHLPGDFGKKIRELKNYVVYPEVNVRFTQRIW